MSTATNQKKIEEPKKAPSLRYQRDKDREKVKGKFIFHEVPGGAISFYFRAYKEDPLERYDLIDGQIYTLPLGVARHLNKNCWYPEYEYVKGDPGVHTGFGGDQMMKVSRKVRRTTFQSLEFLDIDDLEPTSDIATVQII